jgi:hypothetical protein
MRQFIKELRPELRRALAPFPPSNYSKVVDAATRIENEDKLRFGNKVTNSSKKFLNKRPFGQQGNNQRKQARTVLRGGNSNKKTCHTCKKKRHMDKDCWFKNKHRRCFNCGDSNNKKNKCPNLNQFGPRNTNMLNNIIEGNRGANHRGNLPAPQVNAKVFMLGRN